MIPIQREIIEDGRVQVTYRTRDLTARDNKVTHYAVGMFLSLSST